MADLTREQIERHIAAWTWPVQGEADVIMPIQTALALAHMALRSLSGSGVKEGLERAAQLCIDQPQQDGSTYTYWPCVNAIRQAIAALP